MVLQTRGSMGECAPKIGADSRNQATQLDTSIQPRRSWNRILKSCRRDGQFEYLVDWEGYGPEEQSWVKARDILDPLLTKEFMLHTPTRIVHPDVPPFHDNFSYNIYTPFLYIFYFLCIARETPTAVTSFLLCANKHDSYSYENYHVHKQGS